MTNVTEHDSEQEWERDDSEKTRVHLLVRRDTITVHDRLEAFRELVRAVERRRRLIRAELMQDGRDVRTRLFLLA